MVRRLVGRGCEDLRDMGRNANGRLMKEVCNRT